MAEEQKPTKPTPTAFGDTLVSKRAVVAIAGYLLIASLLIFYGLYKFWPNCNYSDSSSTAIANQSANNNANINANNNTNQNANNGGSRPTNTSPDNGNRTTTAIPASDSAVATRAAVSLNSVSPTSGWVGYKTLVILQGTGLMRVAKVTFGGQEAKIVDPRSEQSITVETPPTNPPGKVDVAVINNDGTTSLVPGGYTFTCPPPADSELILVVLLAGALGGTIHALRSLFWYVGNRELVWSWVLMYITLPFIGAAMAAVFFLIIRGGFMDPPKDTEAALYLFALAVLTGLFSQQAALKLADIANAVFTKPGKGEDAKPQQSESVGSDEKPKPGTLVAAIDPSKGKIAGGESVTITNTGLSSVKSITFGKQTLSDADFKFDKDTSTITITTPAATDTGEVDVIITDDAGKTVTIKFLYE